LIHWYFAYASNLSLDQMAARIGPLDRLSFRPERALLPRHRLVFNMHDGGGQTYANIVAPGDGVLGVVYPCTSAALDQLDRFENGYVRRHVTVITAHGHELKACAYFADDSHIMNGRTPSFEYLRRIVTGAREHALPDAYIRAIVALACTNA
jgi:gamma-glutamylcyclotransferase